MNSKANETHTGVFFENSAQFRTDPQLSKFNSLLQGKNYQQIQKFIMGSNACRPVNRQEIVSGQVGKAFTLLKAEKKMILLNALRNGQENMQLLTQDQRRNKMGCFGIEYGKMAQQNQIKQFLSFETLRSLNNDYI